MKRRKFEGMLILWFIIIMMNIVFSTFYACMLLYHYRLSNNVAGGISLIVVFIISIIASIPLTFYLHESGHKLIYAVLGQKATIRKVSFLRYITETPNKGFNDELAKRNPTALIVLSLSGVISSTLMSSILSAITLVLAMLTAYFNQYVITFDRYMSLYVNSTIIYPIGYLSIFAFAYNIILLAEFISTLWSKKSNTDGYKARQVLSK
jgi:hypothetical protein